MSFKLNNFLFKLLYLVISYCYYFKGKQIYNTLTILCEKSEIAPFASSKMKNIAFPAQSRFWGKLAYCISFGSAASACCLLKTLINI